VPRHHPPISITTPSNIGKLIETIDTIHYEEEYYPTAIIRKISNDHGIVNEEAFIEGCIDWIFGDGDGRNSLFLMFCFFICYDKT